jgi:3-oxoacyl-[acyl-carrier-protein] synthase II
MKRRVVITGAGCVTPLGTSMQELWNNASEGRSAVGPITLFDASSFPVQIAAEVRDWDLSAVGEDPSRWKHSHRQSTFAIGAAIQAASDAQLAEADVDPLRLGVYLGCGEPFEDFVPFTESVCRASADGQYRTERFTQSALDVFDHQREREFEPDMPAYHLAEMFNAQGPNANCIAACVSSSQAIGEAAKIIRRGDADIMLCGGAHSTIHPFGLTGFQRLSVLSTRNVDPRSASRPFDRDRDGFVVGEGGAIFVLEDLENARRRKAEIWAELTGYGATQDAFRITDTRPEGSGSASAMRRAIQDARLNADQIDYIHAHGTGTVMNDVAETAAIKKALGQHAYHVPISSSKSMLGHATTACGAIGLALCLSALRHGAVSPTINYETPDPDCDLDYVPNVAREHRSDHVLCNTIGFGGHNAALVVSRFG